MKLKFIAILAVFTAITISCTGQTLPNTVFALSVPGHATKAYGGFIAAASADANISRQLALGIKVCNPDMALSPDTTLTNLLKIADIDGIKVCPQLDASILSRVQTANESTVQAAVIKGLSKYVSMSVGHPCCLRDTSGRLLVFMYGAWQLPPNDWQFVIKNFQDTCCLGFTVSGSTNIPAEWTWSFGPGNTSCETTVMPWYTRVQSDGKPLPLDEPKDGGVRYAQEWAAADSTKAVLIISWNDEGSPKKADGTGIAGNAKLESETLAGIKAWSAKQ